MRFHRLTLAQVEHDLFVRIFGTKILAKVELPAVSSPASGALRMFTEWEHSVNYHNQIHNFAAD